VKEHEAQTKVQSNPPGPKAVAGEQGNSIAKFREWRQLRLKEQALEATRNAALLKAQALGARHTTLASGLDATKGSIPELARHTKAAKDGAQALPQTPQASPQTPQAQHSHEDAATLVERTKAIAADQTILTLVNRRIADQNQLAGVYGQWASVIALQSLRLAHGLLLDALIVIGVLILLLLLDGWLQHLLDRPKLDRRQVETLRSITRMSLRGVAVLIIL